MIGWKLHEGVHSRLDDQDGTFTAVLANISFSFFSVAGGRLGVHLAICPEPEQFVEIQERQNFEA